MTLPYIGPTSAHIFWYSLQTITFTIIYRIIHVLTSQYQYYINIVVFVRLHASLNLNLVPSAYQFPII